MEISFARTDGYVYAGDYYKNFTVRDALYSLDSWYYSRFSMEIFSSKEVSINDCKPYSYELWIDGLD